MASHCCYMMSGRILYSVLKPKLQPGFLNEKPFFEPSLAYRNFSNSSGSHEEKDEIPPQIDIFTASSKGDYHYVKHLLNHVDMNSVNESKWTPLMYAVHNCQENVAKLLVENGASLHICNDKGLNVLMMAARWGYASLVKNFIQLGSTIEVRDKMDWTALFHAVKFNHLEIAAILLEHKANPNAYLRLSGLTPLMCAVSNGNYDMVELLLRSGAILGFKSMFGHDAKSLALEADNKRILSLLNRWESEEISSLLKGPAAFEMKLPHAHYRNSALEEKSACSTLPSNLDSFLTKIGLEEYLPLFREHEVDLLVFLSLTNNDLKECGIKKLGARRKMLEAINRWHSNVSLSNEAEAAYAQRLRMEMELMKTQLKALEERYNQMLPINKEITRRLDQCHKISSHARDSLSSVMQFASVLSLPQMTSDLTYLSVCFEDIYKLSATSKNIQTSSIVDPF